MTSAAGSNAVVAALQAEFGDRLQLGESLGAYSTYRVGGPALALLWVRSAADLQAVHRIIGDTDVPVLVIGKGSNLIVADAGFPGLAITLDEGFDFISPDTQTATVHAGGAAPLPVVARQATKAGLSGFEWAVGVPGSVGGAVRMNAGGHGSDIAASLVSVTRFDLASGELETVPAAHLDLGYRQSNVAASQLILDATFQLTHGAVESGEAQLGDIVRWRREHQPGGANGGSVFANPEGNSAGALIDAAGCKGMRIGSASVSEKHANFIQADAGGSADDVFALIRAVQHRVWETAGVLLRPENKLIGFDLTLLDGQG